MVYQTILSIPNVSVKPYAGVVLTSTTSKRARFKNIKLQSFMTDAEIWAFDNGVRFSLGKTELCTFRVKSTHSDAALQWSGASI